MQLCPTHRQLLSRCTLRWYSAGASSDAVSASDVSVPPRLKRPVASTFGGINIQNVMVRTKSGSHIHRNATKNPARSDGSGDQSPNVNRTNQTDRRRGMGRGGGWDDGLVSLSFSSRLQMRQNNRHTTRGSDTESHLQESRKQNSYKARDSQMHGHRRGYKQQEQHNGGSQTHRRGETDTRKSSTAATVQQGNRTSAPSDAKTNKSSMTRPRSSSPFKHHHADTASPTSPSTSKAPAAQSQPQQPTTASSDRKARLATLSSTNLNELFRTTTTSNTPTTEISIPSLPASTTVSAPDLARARVRSVLERSAGDYSRFLPRVAGARKDTSRLPALTAARNALATQRDVSLNQRRVALHIIGGLVQPRREARA